MLLLGTSGYFWIEGWSLLDSFFMTIITVTTVGFREIGGPLSDAGKIFTSFLIFIGFGVAAIALSHLTSIVMRGELNMALGRRRLENEINALKDHFVIAGYGRTGQVIVEQLKVEQLKAGQQKFKHFSFVVIEENPKVVERLQEMDITVILGDGTQEDILKKAGIERAKGFAAVVSSDAANAFAILTARNMNSKLFILARALEVQSIKKLKIAGANKVVAPYELGGLRMAKALTQPHSSDIIDLIEDVQSEHIEMSDFKIEAGSPHLGRNLGILKIQDRGVLVVGVRKHTGEFIFHPPLTLVLERDDHLVLMGPTKSIQTVLSISI